MENEPRPDAKAPSDPGRARPVDLHERLILLDTLRGLALGGVVLANFNLWFRGRVFMPMDRIRPLIAGPRNEWTGHLFAFFGFGKFITIFSFLFGLGFAVQMIRAEERGGSVAPIYARRLGVLLLIGLLHLFGVWLGARISRRRNRR